MTGCNQGNRRTQFLKLTLSTVRIMELKRARMEARRNLEADVIDLVTEDGLNGGSTEQWTDKRGV